MPEHPNTTLERDKNHITLMPIQASLNPSPNYRRPAIELIESLSLTQLKELLKVNKSNKEYVKDLKMFHSFSKYPQDKIGEMFNNDHTLDNRIQNVLRVTTESIPSDVLVSQAPIQQSPTIFERLISAIFKPKDPVKGKGPKPTLTNAPSPFNSSNGESEEEKKKKKKNEHSFSSPSPTL